MYLDKDFDKIENEVEMEKNPFSLNDLDTNTKVYLNPCFIPLRVHNLVV